MRLRRPAQPYCGRFFGLEQSQPGSRHFGFRSGNPFNILSGTDSNLDGIQTDRPDLIGNPKLESDRSRSQLIAKFFDTAAFRAAATGLNGTAGSNILYGPCSVKVTEGRFNLFNQVNFGAPNSTLTSPGFGRILSASAPRIVQFGLKFVF